MSMQQAMFASHKASGVAAAVLVAVPWGGDHLEAWEWDAGFGTRYSGVNGNNGTGECAMSFNNEWAASADSSDPFVNAWAFDLDNGFGSKFSAPSSLTASACEGLSFSKSSAYLHVTTQTDSFTHVYAFSSDGFGTKVSDPGVAIPGYSFGDDWANDSADVAIGHQSSPNITIYPFTSSYGTKHSNPSSLPAGSITAIAFAADDASMLLADKSGPRTEGYPWSGSGFGTKYSAPSTTPTNSCNSADINYASNEAILAQDSGYPDSTEARIHAYAWSSGSGYGTKRSDPSSLPPGVGNAVRFTHDDAYIIMGHATSPYISAWPYSASGFGTKLSNPSSLPAADGRGIDVTQDV